MLEKGKLSEYELEVLNEYLPESGRPSDLSVKEAFEVFDKLSQIAIDRKFAGQCAEEVHKISDIL